MKIQHLTPRRMARKIDRAPASPRGLNVRSKFVSVLWPFRICSNRKIASHRRINTGQKFVAIKYPGRQYHNNDVCNHLTS